MIKGQRGEVTSVAARRPVNLGAACIPKCTDQPYLRHFIYLSLCADKCIKPQSCLGFLRLSHTKRSNSTESAHPGARYLVARGTTWQARKKLVANPLCLSQLPQPMLYNIQWRVIIQLMHQAFS